MKLCGGHRTLKLIAFDYLRKNASVSSNTDNQKDVVDAYHFFFPEHNVDIWATTLVHGQANSEMGIVI